MFFLQYFKIIKIDLPCYFITYFNILHNLNKFILIQLTFKSIHHIVL